MDSAFTPFCFEKVTQAHLPVLFTWLNAHHVKKFYDAGYDSTALIESKYLTDLSGGGRFIVSENGIPFGFIQSYAIDPLSSYASYRHPQGSTVGIDLFIGESAFLNRGYGLELLRQFVEHLDAGIERILVDPDVANLRSIALFSKYGFQPIGESEGHLILSLDIRKAVRAIIVNPQQEIALMQFKADPAKLEQKHLSTFWLTPGGKVESHDETYTKALMREIQEEVGFTDIHIDRILFSDERIAAWGNYPLRLFNRYYLVHTQQSDFSRLCLMEDEQEFVLDYKWWSLEELSMTQEVIYPPGLKEQLKGILWN